ncbi:MAG: peptidoglycan-binding domain-containing protein [Lysobacteraceae bacterium]
MAKIKIYESVGGNSDPVTNYRDLENHHPSKGMQESGRVYARVNGEAEEILGNYKGTAVLTPGGEYMVSKDMVLTAPGLSNGNVPIPSPAAGVIGKIDRADGIITINDPKTGDMMFQIRHAQVDPNLKPGDKIEYGQSLGLQHGYNNGNPNAFPDHTHFDVNTKYIAQADKWIKDMDSGALTTDKRPAQTENLVTERPSFVPISGNFPKPADPPLADGKLSLGEKGPEVEKLQQALNAAGARDAKGNALNPDKDFGDRTREAVVNYQKTHGQPETGVADRKMLIDLGVIAPQQNQTPPTQTPTQTPPQGQTQTPPQQPTGNKVSGGPNDFGSTNPLGTLISSGEGGYGSYNRGRAGDANGAQIDFSQMTVGEVMRRQDLAKGDPDRLFAVGKYQMIPGTFEEAVNSLGIDRNAKLTPQLQERMFADYLIDEKRPQVKAYITGETSGAQGLQGAQLALAREFASVADPRTRRSVYDGDSAGNSASITAGQVGTALDQMRGQYQQNIKSGMSADEAYRALSGDPNTQAQTQGGQTQGQTRGQSGSTSDTLLLKEERGDGVKGLQEALNKAGIRDAQGQPLPTTGYFGDKTEEAVRKYQEQKGLEVDGKAGKDTLTALGIYPGQQAERTTATQNATTTVNTTEQRPSSTVSEGSKSSQTQSPATSTETPPSNVAPQQMSQTDKPLMSNPNHPDNKLYQQALSNLEQLGPSGGFKSRDEMEKAAAAVAADAKATGLQSIDHISKTSAPNGQNFLVAVQGDPTNAASKNAYIDYGQAVNQGVDQSTKMAEATKPAVQQAQQVDQSQQQENRQEQNKVAIGGR